MLCEFVYAVNFTNADNRTPLHLACVNNHVEVVKFLISAGADCTKSDRWGHTAEYEARENGYEETIYLLTIASTPSSSEDNVSTHQQPVFIGEGSVVEEIR